MRAGATQVEPLEWSSILSPANQRTESKELIECLFAVVNVSTVETKLLLEIQRRDHLGRNNQVANARRICFQLVEHVVRKLFATSGPVALLQLVRCKLNVDRHHVFPGRCE